MTSTQAPSAQVGWLARHLSSPTASQRPPSAPSSCVVGGRGFQGSRGPWPCPWDHSRRCPAHRHTQTHTRLSIHLRWTTPQTFHPRKPCFGWPPMPCSGHSGPLRPLNPARAPLVGGCYIGAGRLLSRCAKGNQLSRFGRPDSVDQLGSPPCPFAAGATTTATARHHDRTALSIIHSH